MTYTEIQVKGGRNYYYRAKSVRDGSKFRKLRKYMGVDLDKEDLKNKEQEMDLLLGESFKGILKDESIGHIRKRLIEDISKINITENPVKIASLKLPAPSLNKVKAMTQQYNKAFHAKVFTLFSSSESEIYSYAKRHPIHFDTCFCFIKNEEGQWYLGTKGMEHVKNWILTEAKKSPQPIFEMYNRWERDWQTYLRLEKELRKTNLSKFSNKKLYEKFKEFFKQFQLVGSIAYICDAFMSYGEEDWLEKLITDELTKLGIPPSKKINLLRRLTCPVHLSFTLEADYQLIKIAGKIINKFNKLPSLKQLEIDSPTLFKALKNHEETFHWVQNNYHNAHYVDINELYKQITELIAGKNKKKLREEIKEKEKELENIRKEREQLLSELGLSRFTKNILRIARLFSKWKDIRKGGVYIGMYHFDCFLDEVARRTEFSKEQLTFSIFNEIKDILNKKNIDKIRKEIKEREKQCFFVYTDKGHFIVGGEKAEKYFKLLEKGKNKSIIEIRGVVASPGYARGRVSIVKKTQDINNFKTGDILVANQTTPEFLPAMKKSAAIVTEQGGITSHAAIVSRELKKPCIIGTKIATTTLLDGEIVEVDAENGIVRRKT
ncbi:hypothetical protein HOC35_07375 [Candidatus Woesearchaeota archaeon]|jgi:phosphoenolpyruvate synthase/pyruvate phosphate dikinase|nr:hypothetical protein [Candidatus Woesearchaeota archaeon]